MDIQKTYFSKTKVAIHAMEDQTFLIQDWAGRFPVLFTNDWDKAKKIRLNILGGAQIMLQALGDNEEIELHKELEGLHQELERARREEILSAENKAKKDKETELAVEQMMGRF
jgi:hypothetical protein